MKPSKLYEALRCVLLTTFHITIDYRDVLSSHSRNVDFVRACSCARFTATFSCCDTPTGLHICTEVTL
jgi:hypothetical protein